MTKRTRCSRGALVLLAAAVLASACDKSSERDDSDRRPLIGLSMDSLVVERWRRDMDAFVSSARDLGAEVEIRVADQDPAVQERQVRELSELGVDVLVIVPNDADLLAAAVREVRAKGIPVLSYDRLVRNAGVDLYVSFDNQRVGYLIASSIAKTRPDGRWVVINGPKADNNALLLNAGMHAVIDPLVASGSVELAAEIWLDAWDSGQARAAFDALLASGQGVDAVAVGNDMLAEAAIGVLSEYRLAGSVPVAGQDADLAACQRIAEGLQTATVYKPIERLALTAAGFAVMLARGEEVSTDSFISDGQDKVPFIRLEPILVTRDTLRSTVIADGFHTEEDVFRNAAD